MTPANAAWWRQATVYQIYPRSYADSNGDGIGDLKGITSKVPYIHSLGVDAVWLSPFYPSPLKDGGYDVADYKDVDPNIGTLDDFDEMVTAFKGLGIKVIVDIVPNHSSNEHVWFQEALRSPRGSAARARFHFLDGKGPDKSEPPNDWQSLFGGSIWEPTGDGQFYLHMFDVSQPDFNWENQEVRDEFLDILKFWGDRGVSGFRVDVAMAMAKDLNEPFLPQEQLVRLHHDLQKNGKTVDTHPYWDRDETLEIFKDWRKLFNQYHPPLTAVGEIAVSSDRVHLYASKHGLGQTFAFDLLKESYHAPSLRNTITNLYNTAKAVGSTTTWVLSSHDVIRHCTRYGIPQAVEPSDNPYVTNDIFCNDFLAGEGKGYSRERGLRRARAATLMMLALPGCSYMYQGEELGLPEVVDLPDDRRQDVVFFKSDGKSIGRDGCRVPIPWTREGKSMGFSSRPDAKEPWLPIPAYFAGVSVEAEDGITNSTLSLYREAMALRRKLQCEEEMEWAAESDSILHFSRPGGWEVLMNVSEVKGVPAPEGEILLTSGGLKNGMIPIDTTVWVKTES